MSFQTFGNSRGHRALVSDVLPGHRSLLSDRLDPFSLQDDEDADEGDSEDTLGPIVMGKGSRKNLKFEWEIKPWKACTATCDENGFQVNFIKLIIYP